MVGWRSARCAPKVVAYPKRAAAPAKPAKRTALGGRWLAGCLLGTTMLMPLSVAGQTWVGTTGIYGAAANWNPATVPSGAAATATFSSTGASAITIIGFHNAGALVFDSTAQAYTFTITGSATMALEGAGITNNSGQTQTFVLSSGSSHMVFNNSATAGDAHLQVSAGIVFFEDTSSAGTATIDVNGGAIQLSDNAKLANAKVSVTGATAILAGSSKGEQAQLTLDGSSVLSVLTTGATDMGSISGSGTIHFGTDVLLTVGANNGSTTFSGIIDGVGTRGAIEKTGTGTWTLSGTNTYAKGTTLTAGTLSISRDANLGSAGGSLIFNGGTLQTTADMATSRATTMNAGGGTFDVASGTTLTHNGVVDGAGGLTKTGDGTLILTAENTFTGSTTIDAGTLALSGSGSVRSFGTMNSAGSTLDISLTTNGYKLEDLTDGAVGASAAVIKLGGKTLTVTGNLFFNGVIDDGGISGGTGGGLTLDQQSGPDPQARLGGVNTYTGTTTVGQNMTLWLVGNGSIAQSRLVDMSGNNSYFDIAGASGARTIKGLQGVASSSIALGNNDLIVDTELSTTYAGTFLSLGGSGGLIKRGSGTLTLVDGVGVSTYTGGTTIEAGILAVSSDGNLGASTGALTLNGGTLQFSTSFDLSTGRTITLLANGGTIDTNSFNTTIAQSISGDGKLTKVGDGALTLSGVNTYLGGTAINGGVLAVSSDANLGDANGGLTFDGGILQFGAGFNLASTRAITLGAGGGTINTDANDTAIGRSIGGAGGLTKLGIGALTLSADNAYTGATTITEGTLVLSGNGSIAASSAVDLNGAGAALDISTANGDRTIQNLSGIGGADGARVVLGANSLVVDSSVATVFDGVIEGSGGLIKRGGETFTLGGTNTYTGETTVAAGTLALTNFEAVGTSAKVTVATGATLDVSRTSAYAQVQTLAGGGMVQLGDSGLEITNGSTEFAGVIDNRGSTSGGVLISGGVQTLTGASTYASRTGIAQGAILALRGDGSISNSLEVDFVASPVGGANTFDISQTTNGTSVQALVEYRSSNGIVALGSKELTLTGTGTDFYGSIQDGGIDPGTGGRLTLAEDARAVLGGGNTYTGATTIRDRAKLSLMGDGSIAPSSVVDLAGAGAIFDVSGVSSGVATIRNLTGSGTVQLGSSALELVQASGEFSGKIVDGLAGGEFVVTSGSLALSGVNSYTGMTAIGGGATLLLKGDGSIADSMAIYFDPRGPAAATFDISQTTNGASVQALLDLKLPGIPVAGGYGVIELGDKTLTVMQGGAFDGTIKGSGGLRLASQAVLSLGGLNTYTGVTTVGAGAILALVDNGSIASSSRLRLDAPNAMFDISCGCFTQQTVQNLDGVAGSLVMLGDNYLRVISTVDTAFSGTILGNGGLIKEGTGTLTLESNSTYGGGTTFKEGAIAILVDGALGSESGALTFDGGVLQFKAQFDLSIMRSITLNGGGGTIDTNGFDTAIGQEITGDGGLTKAGAGTLTLGAINTYLGATAITAGTLALSGGDISSSSGVFVATGATFDVSDNVATQINALTGGGTVKLGSSAGLVIANASGEFSGVITSDLCGCGGAVAIGGGTQILSGVNTYTGITALAAGATLVLTGSGSIANSTGVLFAPFGPGVATFDISQTTSGATVLGLADVAGVGVVSLGSKTLTVGANGGPFAGIIQDGGLGGGIGGGLAVEAPGPDSLDFGLQLAGINTYTGATTILAGGLLAIVGPGGIAASSGVTLAGAGATFDISGDDEDRSQTIKDLSGVADTKVALGGNSLTVGTANSTTFAGVIADGGLYGGRGGALIKQGSGTLTLTGANTYTGGTTINEGMLRLGAGGSLASGGALTVNGGTFDLAGNSQTVGALSGTGGKITLGSGTLTTDSASNTTLASAISGSGKLVKTGSGALTLTGANTYSGGTTVSGGTLIGTTASLQGDIENNAAVVFSQATIGTYAGKMTGSGSLTKSGDGTLILTGDNSYTGGTTIDGGILQLGNGGTTGMIAGNVTVNGSESMLAFNRADDVTFAGEISGSGAVMLMGPGKVTLTGTNSYTGGTVVGGGVVKVADDAAFGAAGGKLSVAAGATVQALASFASSRAVELRLGGGKFDTNGNTLTLSGAVSGRGALTKIGAGTLILTGENTYSGGTVVEAGTLQGTTQSLQGAITNNAVVVFDQATNGTYAGVMSGSGSLTKNGVGTVTLTGANSYTGGTVVNAGVLQLGAGASLATGSALTVNGGTFDLNGNSQTVGALSGAGGVIALGGGTLTTDSASNTTLSSAISGGGGFVKQGTGLLTLTGANTYTGGTTVNDGTLQLGASGSLASGGALTVNGGTFDLNGNSQTVGTLSGTGGTIALGGGVLTTSSANDSTLASALTGSGSLVKQGDGTLTLTGTNSYSGGTTVSGGILQGNTSSLQGAITNNASVVFDQGVSGSYAGVMSGSGALTKTGAGTLSLTGANSYSGGTTVSEGTLQLGAGGSLASGGALAINGGTFDLGGNNQTVGALSGTGGAIALGGGTLTANSAINTALASAISGSGGFVKQGSGVLTFTGTNSYSGGTTVSQGTLRLGAGGSLASGGALAVNGGTFDLGGNNQTVGALSGTGGAITLGSGTLTTNSASNTTLASTISGSGGLVKSGTGTLILSGANSYTGGTVVTGGVLQGNSTSLQGAIVNNASVVFDQDMGAAGSISIGGPRLPGGSETMMGGGAGAGNGTSPLAGAGTLTLNQTAGGTSNGAPPAGGTPLTIGTAASLSGTGALMTTSGGTLVLTGSNTFAGGTTVSAGGTTIFVSGIPAQPPGSGTYAGNMSGTGSLTKTGAATLLLTGTNSYSGGTIVSGGTLAGNTSSLQGNILNNAAVMFDQASNGTYAGVMSGAGALTKMGVATLILTGANSYSGGTTVSGGVLQGNSTSLQGNILNNAAVVFDQASSGVYAGAMSGSGTLTKIGAGLLNLTGSSVVGGGTSVQAGTLAVNGALVSNVTVETGGTVGGTGTITGLLRLNGGTLAPGNSIGTLNVVGNVSQTGGVYQVEVNAQGASDKIVATGTATISGGTVQVLAQSGSYQRNTTYTILTANAGLTGTYGGVTSNFAFLTPSLSYDANNVYLELSQGANAFTFGGQTPNQKAVGRTLDIAAPTATGDFATVLGAIAALNTTQGPQALDTISGQPYASFGSMNVLASLLFMNTVGQQTATARGAAFFGAARVALGEACEVACDMAEPTRWGAWFSGMGGTGSIGGNYNAGTFTYNLGGAAVGVDYRFDPRLLVGLAIGYSSGRQWVGNFQGTGTTDTYSAALYASFAANGMNGGGFYADALAGYAYGDNRLQRVMQIPGLATRYANGGAGANQFLGQIELGYKVGIYEAAQASITPFARFQAVAASQRGFTEWGADSLNLTVQQQNTTSIRTILGADLAANMPIGLERPLGVTLRLGWVHDYADTQRPMTAAFAGAPAVPFTVVGAQPMRDSVAIGFGLSTQISASTSLYARYDGELNGRDDNHNFSAGFRMTW